jgi:tetrahydromethanopterin S-methyltransferase subunit G
MNSNHEQEQVHERLDRLEQKLDFLAEAQQVNRRSPGVRFLIGFAIVIAVVFILMLVIGIIQFISSGG